MRKPPQRSRPLQRRRRSLGGPGAPDHAPGSHPGLQCRAADWCTSCPPGCRLASPRPPSGGGGRASPCGAACWRTPWRSRWARSWRCWVGWLAPRPAGLVTGGAGGGTAALDRHRRGCAAACRRDGSRADAHGPARPVPPPRRPGQHPSGSVLTSGAAPPARRQTALAGAAIVVPTAPDRVPAWSIALSCPVLPCRSSAGC